MRSDIDGQWLLSRFEEHIAIEWTLADRPSFDAPNRLRSILEGAVSAEIQVIYDDDIAVEPGTVQLLDRLKQALEDEGVRIVVDDRHQKQLQQTVERFYRMSNRSRRCGSTCTPIAVRARSE